MIAQYFEQITGNSEQLKRILSKSCDRAEITCSNNEGNIAAGENTDKYWHFKSRWSAPAKNSFAFKRELLGFSIKNLNNDERVQVL